MSSERHKAVSANNLTVPCKTSCGGGGLERHVAIWGWKWKSVNEIKNEKHGQTEVWQNAWMEHWFTSGHRLRPCKASGSCSGLSSASSALVSSHPQIEHEAKRWANAETADPVHFKEGRDRVALPLLRKHACTERVPLPIVLSLRNFAMNSVIRINVWSHEFWNRAASVS